MVREVIPGAEESMFLTREVDFSLSVSPSREHSTYKVPLK